MNALFFGDCLHVLRVLAAEHPQGLADLIYLDPPFNSKRDYSILFKSPKGHESHAQIQAFEDTWHWGEQAEREYDELFHQPNTNVADMMHALRLFLGENDMMAYLVMMANRLLVMHDVLKDTGSLYLHCDPTASHYLKIVLDGVFGAENFTGEIIWRRTAAHVSSKRWPRLHDVILAYGKDVERVVFNSPKVAADQGWLDREYRHEDERGRYSLDNLTGAGTTNGPSGQPWKGVDPKSIGSGRHWRYVPETLDKLDGEGRIYWPKKGQYPKLKQYLEESGGKAVGDLWVDVGLIGRTSSERLGYPTQKPLALLERIIQASSNPGGIVLDPFCGCGTAVHAAQKNGRQWIGIDITHLAISLIEKRLKDAFPGLKYEVHGTPKDIGGAAKLSEIDKYQFQWWACSLVGAQPFQGKKKGADSGIDGLIYFQDEKIEKKKIIVSVKGGDNVNVGMVRDLKGVIEREKAQIGLFVTLAPPSKPMTVEAVSAGYYESPHHGKYPKIQILTIEALLSGRERPLYPDMSGGMTFKKAQREAGEAEQEALFE